MQSRRNEFTCWRNKGWPVIGNQGVVHALAQWSFDNAWWKTGAKAGAPNWVGEGTVAIFFLGPRRVTHARRTFER